MTENNKKKSIQPPASHKERDIARGIIEGAVGIIPGGNILTNIAAITTPSVSKQEQETWQLEISERTNDNTQRLDEHESKINPPQENISGIPAKLIIYFAKDCPDGLGHQSYDLDDLVKAFPNEDKSAIEEAVYELSAVNLIRLDHHFGGWHARLTQNFYEQIDSQIMGWDTIQDAKVIAEKMLEINDGDAPTLHKETGWEKRRFNPAFRIIVSLFPQGRVRNVIQPDYPSLGVLVTPEDKVSLRRFIKGQ